MKNESFDLYENSIQLYDIEICIQIEQAESAIHSFKLPIDKPSKNRHNVSLIEIFLVYY